MITPTRSVSGTAAFLPALRFFKKVLLAAICTASLGACSSWSLYFHNQGYEDATTELKKQVDGLDVTAAFSTLSSSGEALAKDEDAAVVNSMISMRNAYLVQLIDPISGDPLEAAGATAKERLAFLQTTDIRVLAPASDPNSDSDKILMSGAKSLQAAEAAPDRPTKVAALLMDFQSADMTGQIGEAVNGYRISIENQQKASEEAAEKKKEIEDLLEKIGDKGVGEQIKAAIKNLETVSAAAKFAGLDAINTFLECGLIVDLKAASIEDDDEADKAKEKEEEKPTCTAETTNAALGGEHQAKALSSVIKLFVDQLDDAETVNRLKRIDANILALADLRQKLTEAKLTVDYEAVRQRLFTGQLYALLTEYRLLRQSQVAIADAGGYPRFADLRKDNTETRKRGASLALSSYIGAWNYGRTPAALIDFRLHQAERKLELDKAAASASNYKALVQPIADALAAYGKGGITPDTLAEVLSNLGIIAAVAK